MRRYKGYRLIGYTIILLLSLCGNVAFFLSDGLTYLKLRELQKSNNTIYPLCSSIEEFRKQITEVNMEIMLSGNRPEAPKFPLGVIDRIKYNLGIKETSYPFFYWGEPNWLLTATLEDAILHNEKKNIAEIENIFKEKIENMSLDHVDQCMSGGAAILLHQRTGNRRYKDYADKVLKWCLEHDTEYGILYGANDAQLIDGYGMFLPFLNRYANTYNDSVAMKLATKQVEIAIQYLIDPVGGLPVHGFSLLDSHYKQGNCNFGRGISWFLLGLTEFCYSTLNASQIETIDRMDKTLLSIYNNYHQYNQFIGETGNIDMTAHLPILYYLVSKKLIQIEDIQLLEYSKYSDNGMLYNSSGSTSGKYFYSQNFGPNILSQAFMLKLLNENK